ncbi:hypothetical protein FQN54_000886 [Arachnomyces sp. PD_36]|nr:hypothetical protein FQN54_000886 [Arachnomyces sp. PD_36]
MSSSNSTTTEDEHDDEKIANYIEIPMLRELVARAESDTSNFDDGNATLAAAQGILGHYFPVDKGYSVTVRDSGHTEVMNALLTTIQVRYYAPSKPGFHLLIVGDVQMNENVIDEEDHQRLLKTIEKMEERSFLPWGIFLCGPEITFYDFYHSEGGDKIMLRPDYSPSRPSRYQFHLRHDAEAVDELLRDITKRAMILIEESMR